MRNRVQRARRAYLSEINLARPYQLEGAIQLLQDLPKANFVESVEVAIQLGIDPKRSDQVVRGSAVLPNGTGKNVRVAAFAAADEVKSILEVGADDAGLESLAERIKGGDCPFDVIIAKPEHMAFVGRLGPILGPKGLMPNPKLGTVVSDVIAAVRSVKAGQVRYRTDKSGIVHTSIGKLDFPQAMLIENLKALVLAIKGQKPAASKGVFFRNLHLSTTMGPGIMILMSSLDWAK